MKNINELTPESRQAIAMRKLEQERARDAAVRRFNQAQRTASRFFASMTAVAAITLMSAAAMVTSCDTNAKAHESPVLSKSQLLEQHKPLPKVIQPKPEKRSHK